MSKIDNCENFGRFIFQGRSQYTQITTINMYLLIKTKHSILKLYHWNYIEVRKISYMLEIDIFRNSSQRNLGVLRNGTQMPCWLRLCSPVTFNLPHSEIVHDSPANT